ncbi:hypothetical protein DXT99_14420 [Pontibacter diazotrophicus]|uniref:Uncharacterized protein n=1 Tax=Pontibacter diazotrophicus TaxID=1400979 RepID=A0A3D8LA69_9BACT|nr:hypothetical protein [Pontibacter diazotrophicus]RDV14319.1 hypothetical protein DXT99_14420 [Pontibacter diazotrophicus]
MNKLRWSAIYAAMAAGIGTVLLLTLLYFFFYKDSALTLTNYSMNRRRNILDGLRNEAVFLRALDWTSLKLQEK